MKKNIWILFCLITSTVFSQNKTTITETKQVFKTYPFADPNPIPQPDNYYYPYFRFDGFTNEATDKEWKVVVLENDYIRVTVFPEIGGKIWGAIEKSTGKEFIYSNSVVKFRDIAMRGAWTSGGIELNFGIIGHAPTCATPVDYLTRTNDDGSVSCFISATDHFTHTRWETEVNLPHDKAYFTTNTKWYNPTPLVQPYYHWMNAAYQIDGNTEFCFPGTHWIGHDGNAHPWPVDDKGRDLSWYDQNNFGDSKSHHVFGRMSDFYAAYWHDLDFGSVHYSPYGDKLGMKVFLWAHSRAGGIWEDLLTDSDGQYAELQSGRLFNQEVNSSTKTPFKHFGFEPHAVDQFKEYWFPVMHLGGVVKANPIGALNVEKEDGKLHILFCPMQKTNEEIKIYFGDELKYQFKLDIDVLETWQQSIDINDNDQPFKIVLGNSRLIYSENIEETACKRPVKAPLDFDWNSVYGLFIGGQQWMYQKEYDKALEQFEKCLEKDPNFAPALNQMAILYFRKAEWDKALIKARKSLSINTYDPEANFIYGLINRQLGNLWDAQDGFAVATLSPSYRIAANIELAKLFIYKREWIAAKEYLQKVITDHQNHPEANLLMVVLNRKTGEVKHAGKYVRIVKQLFPLNHTASFELFLLKENKETENIFVEEIRNEMPHETFLEIADWYMNIGCFSDAVKLLKMAPKHPIVYLKIAYLFNQLGEKSFSDKYLNESNKLHPDFVFPFRKENLPVLEWASSKSDSWKPNYYLALLQWSLGKQQTARKLFNKCGDVPDFAYFYLARTILFKDVDKYDAEKDILRAVELAKDDWRTYQWKTDYYLDRNLVQPAMKTAQEATRKFPLNNILKYVYAKCLMANEKFAECRQVLDKTTILPSEGARDGRGIYRQACLMEGIDYFRNGYFDMTLKMITKAREWPENLGAGKPYDVDERIEDFFEAECLMHHENRDMANKFYAKVVAYTEARLDWHSSTNYLYLLALRRMGEKEKIEQFLNEWKHFSPNDSVLKWCAFMLENNTNEATKIEHQIRTQAGGTPWDPKYADPDFEIIKALGKVFGH